MIAAQRAQIPLEWQRAAAIDLAGRNVLEALQTSVNPKVIETPIFQGVAQNGIQLNVKARITVRTNLDRYVGGAGEPTIVARVGEGVVSAVGAAIDHKEVLEYPDRISKAVLAKGLDAGTAFEIVSIDIADVDVGKNIGAELQTSQAEADRKIAQAKAAERQYSAQAAEQEQKAETQAMRAKVVEAEAQIPQAIAEAFRSGNLGVMDYYRLNNLKADTEMRSAIGTGVDAARHGQRTGRAPVAAALARRCSTLLGGLIVKRRFKSKSLKHSSSRRCGNPPARARRLKRVRPPARGLRRWERPPPVRPAPVAAPAVPMGRMPDALPQLPAAARLARGAGGAARPAQPVARRAARRASADRRHRRRASLGTTRRAAAAPGAGRHPLTARRVRGTVRAEDRHWPTPR